MHVCSCYNFACQAGLRWPHLLRNGGRIAPPVRKDHHRHRSRRRKDYYELLHVTKGASEAQLKRSYRKLALQYHPVSGVACGTYTARGAVEQGVPGGMHRKGGSAPLCMTASVGPRRLTCHRTK